MKKKLLVASMLAFSCATAGAGAMQGKDLLTFMLQDALASRALSIGYIRGASDATYDVIHCMPPDTSPRDMSGAIALELLSSNETELKRPAIYFVIPALRKNWPCAGK